MKSLWATGQEPQLALRALHEALAPQAARPDGDARLDLLVARRPAGPAPDRGTWRCAPSGSPAARTSRRPARPAAPTSAEHAEAPHAACRRRTRRRGGSAAASPPCPGRAAARSAAAAPPSSAAGDHQVAASAAPRAGSRRATWPAPAPAPALANSDGCRLNTPRSNPPPAIRRGRRRRTARRPAGPPAPGRSSATCRPASGSRPSGTTTMATRPRPMRVQLRPVDRVPAPPRGAVDHRQRRCAQSASTAPRSAQSM